MMTCYRVLLSLLAGGSLLCWTGCRLAEPEPTNASTNVFSTRQYVVEQASRLQLLRPAVRKIVTIGGISDTLEQVHISDWQVELSPFASADISRPAWRDKYLFERTNGAHRYIALDSALAVRLLQVAYDTTATVPTRVLIVRRSENAIYSVSDTMRYDAISGYSVVTEQKALFLPRRSYRVVVLW